MTAEQSIRNIERTMDALNKAARGTLTVKPDPRADLVDLFEARAETHDDKSWIPVEEAVDLVLDREAEMSARPTGEVEWGVRWEYLSPQYPERTDEKPTKEAAEKALSSSAFDGVIVSRVIGPWTGAIS